MAVLLQAKVHEQVALGAVTPPRRRHEQAKGIVLRARPQRTWLRAVREATVFVEERSPPPTVPWPSLPRSVVLLRDLESKRKGCLTSRRPFPCCLPSLARALYHPPLPPTARVHCTPGLDKLYKSYQGRQRSRGAFAALQECLDALAQLVRCRGEEHATRHPGRVSFIRLARFRGACVNAHQA